MFAWKPSGLFLIDFWFDPDSVGVKVAPWTEDIWISRKPDHSTQLEKIREGRLQPPS